MVYGQIQLNSSMVTRSFGKFGANGPYKLQVCRGPLAAYYFGGISFAARRAKTTPRLGAECRNTNGIVVTQPWPEYEMIFNNIPSPELAIDIAIPGRQMCLQKPPFTVACWLHRFGLGFDYRTLCVAATVPNARHARPGEHYARTGSMTLCGMLRGRSFLQTCKSYVV